MSTPVEHGADPHSHHWIPKPTVGGTLTCACGAKYRSGKVVYPTTLSQAEMEALVTATQPTRRSTP